MTNRESGAGPHGRAISDKQLADLAGRAEIGWQIAHIKGEDLPNAIVSPDCARAALAALAEALGVDSVAVAISGTDDADRRRWSRATDWRRRVFCPQLPVLPAPARAVIWDQISTLDEADFESLFAQIFAADDLGLSGTAAIVSLARQLRSGDPVEGRTDYLGLVGRIDARPLGLMFVAGKGPIREIGFVGAAPSIRRTKAVAALLASGIAELRAMGIESISAEIDFENRASASFARKLGARTGGWRAMYRFGQAPARQ